MEPKSLIDQAEKEITTFLVTVIMAVIPIKVAAIPVIGQLIKIFLPVVLGPIAREIAKMGVFTFYRVEGDIKLYRYNLSMGRLKILSEGYKGGQLTEEEKKANEDYDNDFDDVIRWD